MKHIINAFLMAVCATALLCSCKQATIITPEKERVEFSIEGGEININVSSDGPWEVKECPDWITAEILDSILVIKASCNETNKVREGSIKLASDKAEATITVRQVTICTYINPEINEVEIDKEGGTVTVKIDTDGTPTILETPEGFSVSYDSGVLTITASANDGASRHESILLSASPEQASTPIYVTQKGSTCPTCGGKGKITCTKCGGRGYLSGGGEPGPCLRCGGRYGEFTQDDRNGSGRITCPDCGGAGN